MTWVSALRYGLPLLAGFSLGYVWSDWLGESDRSDAAALRADKALIEQATAYTRRLRERDAEVAQRNYRMLLDRLQRALDGEAVKYEYRDRIIERVPRDHLCLDADGLRLLDDAASYSGAGPFAPAGDPGGVDATTAAPAAPDAGLSAQGAARWIDQCRRQYDAAGERLDAWRDWARIHDGVSGRVTIEQESQ